MQTLILLAVDKPRLSAPPGAADTVLVTARNLSSLLDQVTLRVEGVPDGWVQVAPPHLPVFAQSEATAQVTLRPPRDLTAAQAGIYPIRINAQAAEHPGQEGQAAADLEVQLVGEHRLALERAPAPDPGGTVPNGHERYFHLRVQNRANAVLHLRLSGSDPAAALWYKFEPFELDVPAGGDATAALSVRAKQATVEIRGLVFEVVAHGVHQLRGGGEAPAAEQRVAGQFDQAARLPPPQDTPVEAPIVEEPPVVIPEPPPPRSYPTWVLVAAFLILICLVVLVALTWGRP